MNVVIVSEFSQWNDENRNLILLYEKLPLCLKKMEGLRPVKVCSSQSQNIFLLQLNYKKNETKFNDYFLQLTIL